MGLGFRSDRSQHGSGSPVNDWDPTVMEEDVMLDLTGYTLKRYGAGTLDLGSKGKTVIIINANVAYESIAVYGGDSTPTSNEVLRIQKYNSYKVVFPYRYIEVTVDDISLWVKS